MKYQFMPMFWGDFLANTMHLSTQEIGAYVLLIAHAWENDGHLPYDRLHRIARVNPYHWARVWKQLEPFFEVERTSVGAPLLVHHRRVTIERAKATELSNKNKANAQPKRGNGSGLAKPNDPHLHLQLPIENLSNCKGREAPQAAPVPPSVPRPVLPSVIDYRDPGNDYRSPPRSKPDLPPMTDEQRLAAIRLAAKTESTPRKDAAHEQPTSADHAQSHAHASADPATAEPIE